MAVTGEQFKNAYVEGLSFPGAHYGADDCPHRCRPDQWPHCEDCSGIFSWAMCRVGLQLIGYCAGSFQLAIDAHRAGPGIPFEEALWIPGCGVWQGTNEGQGGVPGRDHGHVGICVGDGVHTLEARGHYAGIGMFNARSLVWDWCGMPAGVSRTGVVGTPAPTPSITMPTPLVHKEEMNMIILPRTRLTPVGEVATARVEPTFNFLLLESGARLDGDQPVTSDKSGETHFWLPPAKAQIPGWQILGVADARPSEQALVIRYGFPNGDTGTYKATIPVPQGV